MPGTPAATIAARCGCPSVVAGVPCVDREKRIECLVEGSVRLYQPFHRPFLRNPGRSRYLDIAIVAVMFQRKRASGCLGMTTTV
jgi:hypothetical protein